MALMKILRLPVALLLIVQFVAAPPAGAESLPYSLVDKDKYRSGATLLRRWTVLISGTKNRSPFRT